MCPNQMSRAAKQAVKLRLCPSKVYALNHPNSFLLYFNFSSFPKPSKTTLQKSLLSTARAKTDHPPTLIPSSTLLSACVEWTFKIQYLFWVNGSVDTVCGMQGSPACHQWLTGCLVSLWDNTGLGPRTS